MILSPHAAAEQSEFSWFARACRAPRLRTMREFAEAEIVLPTGPFARLRYRCDRQPYSAHYFAAVDGQQYQVIAAVGPSQTGKTVTCTVIPLLYHLFELRETVIFGLPDMDMAKDKWERDILPVLERTRYRDLLPERGEGSRGGAVKNAVTFKNGSMLKFMTAGGDDKGRAAFTSRVLVITEADGFGETSEVSAESTKLEQLFARVRAYGSRARIYLESTASTSRGVIWSQYLLGTQSRLLADCPHCGAWIQPERDQLTGWAACDNEIDAELFATFVCPACEAEITDPQRRAMNGRLRLVHRGQMLDHAGNIQGDPPKTRTLGFRWNAWHNQLLTTGELAVDEWRAARNPDETARERKMHQFVWALPYDGDAEEITILQAASLSARQHPWRRGEVPPDTVAITAGVDLGKHLGHYIVIAWADGFVGRVIDYGRFDVAGADLAVDVAIERALALFAEQVLDPGWAIAGKNGEVRTADNVLIDSGYQPKAVGRFLRSRPEQGLWACKGWGFGHFQAERYLQPRGKSKLVRAVGENYHLSADPDLGLRVDIGADAWKSFLFARLSSPVAGPGAIALYRAAAKEHTTLTKHWTAERQILRKSSDGPDELVWEKIHSNNHYLDATAYACCGGHFAGIRMPESAPPAAPPPRAAPFPRLETPAGQPFFVLDRN